VLQSPRVLFSMAERGELPRLFARVHPEFRTPDVAILSYSLLAFGLAVYGSFQWNATLSAVVRLVTYGLTCASLPLFRMRQDAPEAGFRVPLAPFVVPVSLTLAGWLLFSGPRQHVQVLVGLVAAGAVLYLASRGRKIEPA
jgi:amino acid transporter